MVRSSIRLSRSERLNPIAADVAALVEARGGNGDDYRAALLLLAEPQAEAERHELRRLILASCFVLAVLACAAAAASGVNTVFGCAAAALVVALVAWRLWFDVRV